MPRIIKLIRKFERRFNHDLYLKNETCIFTNELIRIATCRKCKFKIKMYRKTIDYKTHAKNLLKCEEYIIKDIIE